LAGSARGTEGARAHSTLALMLESLRRLLEGGSPVAPSRPDQREHALRLAASALLFEVVRADGEVKPEERTVMRTAMQSAFSLTEAEAQELMARAEEESREAASLFEFTNLIDQAFSPEEKKRLVELLWMVSFADAVKHADEEHLVRRIAGLLHVPHPDFIDAKIRARARSGP
jgi:uncharacterized tellurite resistance protein B-like protein